MAQAKRCERCGAAMVYDGRTTIKIVFVVNRFGVRPPDLMAPEVATAWSCTGCGSTVRAGVDGVPRRVIEDECAHLHLRRQRQSDPKSNEKSS